MTRRAFTMLELIICMGLIAILAGIAVPNFLDAQVRAKVSRSRADMATLMAALEQYHADHHAYPPNIAQDREVLESVSLPTRPEELRTLQHSGQDLRAGRFTRFTGYPIRQYSEVYSTGLVRLTTPVQYAPPVWSDGFALVRGRPYSYVNWTEVNPQGLPFLPTEPRVPVLLVGYGPDSSLTTDLPTNVGAVQYDPTNGTTSTGDLYEYPR